MTFYTTPLQFGYFFSLLMTILFWYRGIKENRLSDRLLGMVMLILGLELQDYTFGFSGINFLWEELNGFPRSVSLLFGPAIYYYIKSQTNRNFKFKHKDALHFIPWLTYFIIEFTVFIQGNDSVVEYQNSVLAEYLGVLNYVVRLLSYLFYFYLSLKTYTAYRKWAINQYSNIEVISFRWFRDFIYLMILWIAAREILIIIDELLSLNFYEDWWWNLPLAFTSIYIGISGYSQKQPTNLNFEQLDTAKYENQNHTSLANVLLAKMATEKYFLQSELSLRELASHLNTNSNELSACINQQFQMNFNDYINSLRIKAFEKRIKNKDFKQFTILSLAFDSGFNSKATFNRAFKKAKGISPKEFISNSET